ncbi:MAG: anion permease [Bacilli bacterium]
MIISIFGCVLLFMPGIQVLNFKAFLKENSWDAFFLVATVITLCGAMSDFGVMKLVGDALPTLSMCIIPKLMIICVLTFVCIIIDPVSTSLVSILGPILITIGALYLTTNAIDPNMAKLIILAFSLCLCNCYILPLDTVPLITYSKGHYSMTEMFKCTIILQVSLTILVSLWIPVVGLMFGLI